MKYIYSILLVLFVTFGAQAQNCVWTASNPSGNVAVLIPSPGFPAGQFYGIWTFGNGTSSGPVAVGPITQVYNSPGVYSVCLNVYDSLNGGIICTHCDSVLVGANNCSFTYTQDSSNANQYYFSANLQGTNTVANWSFGDGSSGTGNNVTHTYAATGTYTVTMTEVDFFNNVICTYTYTIVVSPTISCAFGYTFPNPAQNPALLQFNAGFNTPGAQYFWDFGDSTAQGTGSNPQHAFAQAGVYNVCLTIIYGGNSCTYCMMIPVVNGGANCSFTASPDSTNSNLWTFVGLPSQLITVLNWDFGDNTTGVGNGITHLYNAPGVYTVCMNEIELATGTVVCSYCMPITIGGSGSNCAFTATPAPANPGTFSFNTQAIPNNTYYWDFGNGATATGNNVAYTYPAPGVYTVCLSVGNGGAVICTSCQTITVPPNNPSCVASFTSVSVGLIAYFIDQSTVNPPNVPPLPTPVNYSWNFGDGNFSTLQFPQHQYSATGTYLVCLTVSTVGCTTTYCDSVVIDTLGGNPVGCNAYFIFTQTTPYQLIGVNLSSGVNLNFSWDFGDGSPLGTGAYPTHQYTSTGTYVVCLTVSDFFGCSDTYCDTLTVDSLGNIIYRGFSANAGFTLNIISPSQLTSGIDDQENTISRIYPVPATDRLFVEWAANTADAMNYQIIGVDGREVMRGWVTRTANQLNTDALSPGIYLFKVMGADGSVDSRTFVKQ